MGSLFFSSYTKSSWLEPLPCCLIPSLALKCRVLEDFCPLLLSRKTHTYISVLEPQKSARCLFSGHTCRKRLFTPLVITVACMFCAFFDLNAPIHTKSKHARLQLQTDAALTAVTRRLTISIISDESIHLYFFLKSMKNKLE
jgi:hypothetical protein